MSTPTPPGLDPRLVAQLSGECYALEQHLYAVGAHVAHLRAQLDRLAVAPAPAPVPPMSRAPAPPPPPVPSVAPPRPPAPAREPWWQRDGVISRLLAVAGVAVTLIGVVMLLVLAAQAGVFGPVPRVVSGAVLSAALVAAGIRVHRRDGGRVGGAALAATGFAGGYLVVFAATAYYRWVPAVVGLAAALVVAGAGVALAVRWSDRILAVLLVLGAALLAPTLSDGDPLLLLGFLLVLLVASFPAQWHRNWALLHLARVVPIAAVLLVSIAGAELAERGELAWLVGFSVAVAAFVAGTAVLLLRREPGDVVAAVCLAVAALPLLAVGLRLDRWPAVALEGTAAAGYLVLFALVGPRSRPLRVASVAVAAFALLHACLAGASPDAAATVLLAVAAGYAGAAASMRSRLLYVAGLGFWVLGGAMFYDGAELENLTDRELAVDRLDAATLVTAVLLAAVTLLLAWTATRLRLVRERGVPWMWSGAALVVLYAVTTALVTAGVLLGGADAGFVAGHTAATICWMIAATAMLALGLARTEYAHAALAAGLSLTGAALAKLFLFDLAALEGVWRVVAFIVVGLLLLAAGTRYAKAFAGRSAAPETGSGRETGSGSAEPGPGED